MIRLRPELEDLHPYVPGRGEREILDDYDLSHVVKLASNESPAEPVPDVVSAIREAASGVNRYPDTDYTELGAELGRRLGVAPGALWFGGGGAELIRDMTLAVAGPASSVVFPHPSFVVYGIATTIAGATPRAVPLDADHRIDIDAMITAVAEDTTLVFVCNPNNPTGTHVPTSEVVRLLDSVDNHVAVVVDEAYLHYVAAADYETMVPLTQERPNLVVLHTFSKIYGLAGLRIGYAVGHPHALAQFRRVQLPFTASRVAQAAALEALQHDESVASLVEANAAARRLLVDGLAARQVPMADSQANFVFCRLAGEASQMSDALLHRGVIVRTVGPAWTRVSVGSEDDVRSFLTAYDDACAELD